MKVSGINAQARLSFATNNKPQNNPKINSSCNFRGGNDSTKVGAAILGASALIGFLIYLGLAPQAKKASTSEKPALETTSKPTSFSKNHKKDVTVNRPSNKHYQEYLKKQIA
jgi:hypothetical protein